MIARRPWASFLVRVISAQIVHSAAHVGIEGTKAVPNQKLSVNGVGYGTVADLEIFWLGSLVRAAGQSNLPVCLWRHFESFRTA